MEKQSIPSPISPSPQLKQLYDIRYRNYEWQNFRYQLPRKYTHNSTSFIRSGSLFGTKKNYLDSLVKQKKNIPAPNQYTNLTPSRPQSGKMDRSKKFTISEQVYEQSQKDKIPGPGSYFARPHSSNVYSHTQRQKIIIEKPHYLNEVQYLAGTSPGVGSYNITTSPHIGVPKIKKATYNQPPNSKNKQNHLLLNIASSYSGTFQWLKSQPKRKNTHFFGTSQRFHTRPKNQKKPAPNTYKFNHNWTEKNNLLNTIATNTMKNVYYH